MLRLLYVASGAVFNKIICENTPIACRYIIERFLNKRFVLHYFANQVTRLILNIWRNYIGELFLFCFFENIINYSGC